MSNPFATPLRLARRELDELSRRIAEQQELIAGADARYELLLAVRAAEREQAAGDPALPPSAWFARSEGEGRELQRARAAAEQLLASLREQALAQLGRQSALERAADEWEAERRKVFARREQAAADERAAGQLARAA